MNGVHVNSVNLIYDSYIIFGTIEPSQKLFFHEWSACQISVLLLPRLSKFSSMSETLKNEVASSTVRATSNAGVHRFINA